MGGQFLGLGEAYIPNLSLLVCLEAFKKFVWWWWWGGGVVSYTNYHVNQPGLALG